MKQIILALFFLTAFFTTANAAKCEVAGRIVDDAGKPVTEAEIYYGGDFRDDVDSIIVINKPFETGEFGVSRTCAENPFYLFVTSLIDRKNTVVAIEPPFTMQQGRNKDFPSLAGIRIAKRNADVGNIKIQTVYQRVKISFRNERGEPLFPTVDDLLNVKFTLKNEKGKYVTENNLYKKEAFTDDSSVLMSLPEGNWMLEINLKNGKGKTLRPDKIMQIVRSDDDLREITLKMLSRK